MTVITKPLSDKKPDKLDQPLVPAEFLPHRDVEAGAGAASHVDPRVLVLRARARRASSVTTACLLMMALLVMCCGILGGFYLYKQFAHAQMHRFRGWCRIPYAEQQNMEEDPFFADSNKMNFGVLQSAENRFLKEEFDIDADSNNEKITVPTFDGSRSTRVIHDFNLNLTGIVDVTARRCFIMPLNRTQVLVPRDLMDLVREIQNGNFEVDINTVRETMRVVLPPIEDRRIAGMYIQPECKGMNIYKLEKIVSGVFKRSAEISSDPSTFMSFAGKQYVQLKITNEDAVAAYEAAHLLS